LFLWLKISKNPDALEETKNGTWMTLEERIIADRDFLGLLENILPRKH
jgi:hypothetical protein